MYWYRLERSLGRFSLVGTTIRVAQRLPRLLAADEQHTTLIEDKSRKVYLAATAGGGCCLGLALAETAGADDLTKERSEKMRLWVQEPQTDQGTGQPEERLLKLRKPIQPAP